MSFGVTDNFFFNMTIAGITLPVEPRMFREITVTQDLDKMVPVFRVAMQDTGGNLSELLPYDLSANSVTLEFGASPASNDLNRFAFRVLRRFPQSQGMFEMVGMLDVPGLYNFSQSRSFSQSIKTTLESIATEMGVSSTLVSPSLDYVKTLVQPNWITARWLGYLQNRLVGRGGEFGWRCFIKNARGQATLVFRSLGELFSDPVQYNFIVGERSFQDHLPLFDVQVFDNSGILNHFGPQSQKYQYYDFNAGVFQSNQETSIADQPSLTEFHLVDNSDTADGVPILFGRSTSFNPDFIGPIQTAYANRLLDSVQMWAVSPGLENIVPGDIVKVVFAESFARGNQYTYQHSGHWMVKRVVHIFDTTFVTRLLLVRTGIDTASDTTLMPVQDQKR